MPRLIIHQAHGPLVVGDKRVCRCGLSGNHPWCDGSHHKTEDENEQVLYSYDKDGTRHEVAATDTALQPN